MPPSKAVGTEYRYAVEQAVRYRRPVAIMIDEAQHLGKIPSGRRLLDQLDVVKSIANQTKTVHVLLGTYDLLAFRNLNVQLSRRSIDVHLARYHADDTDDRHLGLDIHLGKVLEVADNVLETPNVVYGYRDAHF